MAHPIARFLDSLGTPPEEIVLRRCLSESWFADTLAWLLDPRGSHGFGIHFERLFVRRLARLRAGDPEVGEPREYDRRETHLKWGHSKQKGKPSSDLNLGNSTVLRDFYLSGAVEHNPGRHVDVVIADLDSSDGFFGVIDSTLFGHNAPGLLRTTFDTVEARYKRARIREYAYLTLTGTPPVAHDLADEKAHAHWVCMGWCTDVHDLLLEAREAVDTPIHPEVEQLQGLIKWIRRLLGLGQTELFSVATPLRQRIDAFAADVLTAATACLHEELVRLNKEDTGGRWEEPKEGPGASMILTYTKSRAHELVVELMPTFSVAVQSPRQAGRAPFEKVLVPFGAHPDQVFNLLDIAARDIYHAHFAQPMQYLADKRRMRTRSAVKLEHEKLFRFLYQRRFELRVLLTTVALPA